MQDNLSTAPMPSYVWISEGLPCATILDFLCYKFPRIERDTWVSRIQNNKITFEDGGMINLSTPYQGNKRLKYFREVVNEKVIPFQEEILFENEDILVIDKPHFLPIHPAGKFVNETLVSRLKTKHNYPELAIAHRLDRLTAGLVLATKRKEVRAAYQQLFMDRQISKTYLAIGPLPINDQKYWHVKNHIAPYLAHFRMKVLGQEPANSESTIELIETQGDLGLFRLSPVSGKKHQLRVHMTCIGSKVLNDPLYPDYSPTPQDDDYNKPLQLKAHGLSFIDPVSNKKLTFKSNLKLNYF